MRVKPEIRILGVDDAPFSFDDDTTALIGCLFRGGRQIEAVLRRDITVDGHDADDKIVSMVNDSRQTDQIQVIMLDGVSFAGFNVPDIEHIHEATCKPVIAVSRRRPDRADLEAALDNVDDRDDRLARIEKAGEVSRLATDDGELYYQTRGIDPEDAEQVIKTALRRGNVPEPVRVAHLVAAGVTTGESKGNP
ncbi:MAG: DUF99 family protein [Candidatus Nanohaloarchaea archaeon]|nr:DUF99 family protein [Candidatus Nanohaloarchaea archaeon]